MGLSTRVKCDMELRKFMCGCFSIILSLKKKKKLQLFTLICCLMCVHKCAYVRARACACVCVCERRVCLRECGGNVCNE